MRKVGPESRKTYQKKIDNGFFNKFMKGNGLDIGFSGGEKDSLPILETAIGVDLDFPGYDGKTLPFPNNSQDYVYSSHCLEHIVDYKHTLQDWFRVTKINGYIIIVVPHRDLYEKKLDLPSRFNGDHKRFYTPASLLKEIEESLPNNHYRIRHLHDNDFKHNYNDPPEKHGNWEYELEVVVEKIK